MKGKIDNTGWLYKEAPNGVMQACACCVDRSEFCHWSCVAFDGPLPEKECAQVDGDGTICPGRCEKCELLKPTGRMEIHYCKGVLRFNEFVDERVPNCGHSNLIISKNDAAVKERLAAGPWRTDVENAPIQTILLLLIDKDHWCIGGRLNSGEFHTMSEEIKPIAWAEINTEMPK